MRMIAGSLQQASPQDKAVRVAPFVAVAIITMLSSACGGGGGGGGGSNAQPVLGAASFSTSEDTDLSGQLTATDADGDTVTFAKASDPGHGTLTSLASSGAFVYKPNANYSGGDSFTVRLTDSRGATATSTVSLSVTGVNDAPTAVNDVLRADGAALASINVKANDTDVDGDATTIAITEAPVVGTATVNADGTIRLNMPANFKGVTRFKYSATDPANASNTASAAIFVGADPFRVVFAGDENANGQPEVFMTDFVATFRVSAATEGNLRLKGFAAAENGSTIAYSRQDSNTNALDLSFNRNADLGSQTRVTLPNSYSLVAGADQYIVSRDGKWIAFLATAGSKISPFVLNVDSPTAIRTVEAGGTAVYASQLKFSYDSSYLYFLGSNTNDSQKTLYRVLLAGNGVGTPISVGGSSGNDVIEYQVAQDQSRVAITATRGGTVGVYSIDPTAPAAEIPLNAGVMGTVERTTLSKPLGLGSPTDGGKIAFTTRELLFTIRSYVASLSSGAPPQLVQSFPVTALSPNADYLLYSRSATANPFQPQIWETVLAGGTADATVGDGDDAVYDSDESTVILTKQVSGKNILTTSYRGDFGNTTQLGTAGQVAHFFGLSGAGRAVALIGEGAASGTVNEVHLALINARAPGASLYLSAFNSPLSLGPGLATVVTY
jgi:VCBS repeat-containing protein